jgi:hypothetical protein
VFGLTNHLSTTGLQTPKLKRLAEIVSAQALQQQERQEGGAVHTNGNGYGDGTQGLAIENVDGPAGGL